MIKRNSSPFSESSNKLLSDIVAFRTYSKYIPSEKRRESLTETINRNKEMFIKKYPFLKEEIEYIYDNYVHTLKIMPSMRSIQFAGKAIEKSNARLYNCSFLHINNTKAFSEIFFLLLSGTGAGYSIQKHHVNMLPTIKSPKEEEIYIINDSLIGWAESLNVLMESYFYGKIRPVFDYSRIREKGTYLHTSGGFAPGPDPLQNMLEKIETILKQSVGTKLRSIQVHDIVCNIADAVLAGGIRRAACIALFSKDDEEMLHSKTGEWWINNPQRSRANNTVVLERQSTTKKDFEKIWNAMIDSNSGEPGFFFTNDIEYGLNPCGEVSLTNMTFCNLTSINQSVIKTKQELFDVVKAASILGTLQAGFTDFHYLREEWEINTKQDALLGISFTGIADNGDMFDEQTLYEASQHAVEVNRLYANKIGINPAARVTSLKPEGTLSCVVGSSSGIHARHAKYYFRRIRMNKNDELSKYLLNVIPDLIEEDLFDETSIVVSIPQKSPDNSILREDENAIDMTKRVLKYNKSWIKGGHVRGSNRNNVSCTINHKQNEIEELKEMLWDNRNEYTAVSLLPYDGGSYKQAPFEEITQEVYERWEKYIDGKIDLTEIVENIDVNDFTSQVACSGGACELINFSGNSTMVAK